jgi:hypothetical protein
VVLSAHAEETFFVDTDEERVTLHLEKSRRRFSEGKPHTRYRFVRETSEPLPEDPVPTGTEANLSVTTKRQDSLLPPILKGAKENTVDAGSFVVQPSGEVIVLNGSPGLGHDYLSDCTPGACYEPR